MNPHYPRVAQRAGHRCEYCRAPEAIFNFPFEVEHILPTARAGADDEDNLALACRACNLYKADRVAGVDDQTGCLAALFHPRQNTWLEHFAVELPTGTIQGTTPVGRVTVACLQMNRPVQRAARLQWRRLGLFP